MHKYDYSFLKDAVPRNIVNLTNIIAALRSREEFRKLQYSDAFESLRQKAIIESVKGSNAIEGIVTTDDRIRDIVAGAVPITHDEMEISGYKDALNLIHSDYENLDLTQELVCRFHRMIEEETNRLDAGQYKKNGQLHYGIRAGWKQTGEIQTCCGKKSSGKHGTADIGVLWSKAGF